ncbi:hypothetical protein G7L43_23255, partial [Shigella sonnei]|uniref:hypothetical protein n=1 Tax=Shigella sonnei TaxID=624 RepID=UPI001494C823|nr:hypothetical protein [Shigella sonnei]
MTITPTPTVRRLLSATAIAACIAAPTFAHAEDDPQSQSSRSSATQGVASVGDIVVTARRRDERAQDVPIALTVVN